jgi:hypothetical protein
VTTVVTSMHYPCNHTWPLTIHETVCQGQTLITLEEVAAGGRTER